MTLLIPNDRFSFRLLNGFILTVKVDDLSLSDQEYFFDALNECLKNNKNDLMILTLNASPIMRARISEFCRLNKIQELNRYVLDEEEPSACALLSDDQKVIKKLEHLCDYRPLNETTCSETIVKMTIFYSFPQNYGCIVWNNVDLPVEKGNTSISAGEKALHALNLGMSPESQLQIVNVEVITSLESEHCYIRRISSCFTFEQLQDAIGRGFAPIRLKLEDIPRLSIQMIDENSPECPS